MPSGSTDLMSRVEDLARIAEPGVAALAVTITTDDGPARVALMLADPGGTVDRQRLHERLAGDLGEEAPVAYGVVSALPGSHELARRALADQVRAGSIAIVGPEAGSRELGPRAVRDTPWVRAIGLSLAGHTRGSVNAYVVETGAGYVLVDSGFRTTAADLTRALHVAGVGRGEIAAVLVTHNHADHVGAASTLRGSGWLTPDGVIAMHAMTDLVGRAVFVERDQQFIEQLTANGVGPADADIWRGDVALLAELADWPENPRLLADRERLRVGDVEFDLCYAPGHSPDHSAVIARRDGGGEAAFLGDLSLGDGLPMCGLRDWLRDDPLSDLLDSWQRLLSLTDGIGLPGHGRPVPSLPELHGKLLAAYVRSLREFRGRFGGRTISAADAMNELIPPGSAYGPRQFALYGSLARLHHLSRAGLAELTETGPYRYLVAPLT
jgi:glyoxylase-like metal-dependent hydrolase (beta-lactamase superfamily II)